MAPLPRVDFPTISVTANLPGASPQTMASAVATPLERRFGRIAGVNEMTSSSTLGTTSITLQFDLDRDVEAAARDVQAAINAAGGELPPNLPFRPRYRKVNPADAPILIYSLRSKSLPLSDIFEAGNTVFAQKISQVDGVGQVFVGGGQQPAVRVQADPAALASAGMTLEDVRTALGALTVDRPKGVIGGAMTQQTIAANDQLVGADAWKGAIIQLQERRRGPPGRRGPRHRQRRERARRRLVRRRAHRHPHRAPAAGRQHPRRHRAGQGGHPAAGALDLARHRRAPDDGPRRRPSAPRWPTSSCR